MRKLLAILPIVALGVCSNALVASAGLPDESAPPATTGYLTLFRDDARSAAALSDGVTADEIRAAQGGCTADLATVDLGTGVITDLSADVSEAQCAGDLAFAPDGTLYGLVQGENEGGLAVAELVRYDLTTGAAEFIGPFGPFTTSLGGVSMLPFGGITFIDGTLYAMLGADPEEPGYDTSCATPATGDEIVFCLYRVDDPNNPAATTLIGQVGTFEEQIFSGLASSCAGAMYTATFPFSDEDSTILTVDPATGAPTALGTLQSDHIFFGGDLDRSGTFWMLDGAFDGPDGGFAISTIDTGGGSPIETDGPPVTFNGSNEGFFAEALAVEPCTPVEPEPVVLAPTFTG